MYLKSAFVFFISMLTFLSLTWLILPQVPELQA